MTTTTTTTLDFVQKKGRAPGAAYAVVTGGNGWRYEILKRYAKDDAKAHARWLCNVHGFATETGDTYVRDVVSIAAVLESVEGDEPTTDQLDQFQALKLALASTSGGVSIFG